MDITEAMAKIMDALKALDPEVYHKLLAGDVFSALRGLGFSKDAAEVATNKPPAQRRRRRSKAELEAAKANGEPRRRRAPMAETVQIVDEEPGPEENE